MESEEIEKLIEDAVSTGCMDLSSMSLAEVPPGIGACAGLTYLTLSCNALEQLPPEIGSFQALRELDVSYNKLRALPPELFTQLSLLSHLDASYNQIEVLPYEVGCLTSLQSLSLHDNALGELPPSIAQLPDLQSVQLQYNRLQKLPPLLAGTQQRGLRQLRLEGNPLPGAVLEAAEALTAAADGQEAGVAGPGAQEVEQALVALRQALVQNFGAAEPSEKVQRNGSGQSQHQRSRADILVLDRTASDTLAASPIISPRRLPSFDGQLQPDGAASLLQGDGDGDGSDAAGGWQQQQHPADDDESDVGALGRWSHVNMDELAQLPPAAAAALYRTLDSISTGVREVQCGRPLSRGGTASGGPGATLAPSFLAGCARTAGGSRPGSSLPRPGTVLAARPGSAADRQLRGSTAPIAASSGSGSHAARPSWLPSAQPSGVAALLNSSAGRPGSSSSSTRSSLWTGPAAGRLPGVQGASQQHGAGFAAAGSAGELSEGMAAVTYPLTAGIRAMLRQVSAKQNEQPQDKTVPPGAAVGTGQPAWPQAGCCSRSTPGLAGGDWQGSHGRSPPDLPPNVLTAAAAGAGCGDDPVDIVRGLLAQKADLLQNLDLALTREAQGAVADNEGGDAEASGDDENDGGDCGRDNDEAGAAVGIPHACKEWAGS